MTSALLPCCCWPHVEWFRKFLNAGAVTLEVHDHFEKQTYRNRYAILTANNVLQLTVPIIHTGSRQHTVDVKIFYGDRWQARHWGALTSAYRSSPYFEFFEDDIRPFYFEKIESLSEYNLLQIKTIMGILRHPKPFETTTSYVENPDGDARDLRWIEKFPPGYSGGDKPFEKYYQTFSNKFDFVSNLSMLDLLFNEGLKAIDYLKRK